MTSVIHDMAREAYDAVQAERFSSLKHFAKSPAHYRAALSEQRDSASMQRGRCVHVACLEPHKFASEVIVYPGATRRGKEWEAFERAHAAKEILTAAEYAVVEASAISVRSSSQAAPYLDGGKGEVSVLWECMGVPLKSRIDWVADCGALVDLKNTKDASPGGFGREVANFQTIAQASFYTDAWFAATGEPLPYALIAVEAASPHVTQVYRIPDHLLAIGREQYRGWLKSLIQCRETGRWDSYATGELELQMPNWFFPQETA